MMMSLHRRLLLAASVALAAFFSITGLVLEGAYRNSAEQAVYDRLQGQVIALIAAIEQHEDGTVYLANALAEARFFTPDSGLYGQVSRNDGGDSWRSPSWPDGEAITIRLERGQRRSDQSQRLQGRPVFSFSLGISWGEFAPFEHSYTFTVAEHRQAFDEQLAAYRHLLWGWLSALALALLVVQGSILRWGLAPLRRVAAELVEIKSGHQTDLQQVYPPELSGLTANLNAVLETQRSQLQRYRDALGDLAHSLKTPLALLRGSVESSQSQQQELVREQVDRMVQIVDYQLQRAAAAGRTALAAPVNIAALAGQVMTALDKVYFDRAMVAESLVDVGLQVQIDAQDLMELLGNLLDNAYKYGRQRIVLTAGLNEGNGDAGPVFECCIEDDGPGIDAACRDHVLQRGTRLDAGGASEDKLVAATVNGQGIGLAVVRDIVAAYGGHMVIDRSRWQGARVCVFLPLMDAAG